ncbi:MAG: peptidoglycan-binding domain-containing protein [Blastocatellia bacterium]
MGTTSREWRQDEHSRGTCASARWRWGRLLAALLLTGSGVLVALPQSPPARRPRLARPPVCSTEVEIRQLQQSLEERGLYQGPLSGRLDRATRAALGRYQQIVGLPKTSRPDLETCRQLTVTARVTQSLAPSSAPARPVDSSLPPTVWQSLADSPSNMTRTGRTLTEKLAEGMAKGTRNASGELEHTAQRSTTSLIGRADTRTLRDVRELLEADPRTAFWPASVEEGLVTLKVPRGSRLDPTPIVESIRRIAGVKSVFLILY